MTARKMIPRRLLAWLLCLGMMLSMLPAAAAAELPQEGGPEILEEQGPHPDAPGEDPEEGSGTPGPSDSDLLEEAEPGPGTEQPDLEDAGDILPQADPVYAGPGTIDNTSESVAYDGSWADWYGLYYTNTVGAAVEVNFCGTGIAVYGQKAFNGPYMSAEVDGESAGKLDFYNSSSTTDNVLIGEIKGLENANHTLRLVFLDEANPAASTSSQGLYQAAIKTFAITGAVEGPDPGPAPSDPDVGYADGAIHDEWAQDPATVRGEGAVCEAVGGKRDLKAGDGNGNGTDAANTSNPYPAAFIDSTMSEALAKAGADDPLFLEFTLERVSASNMTQFGVYLNYEAPGKAFFVGCDAGGWFWQTGSGDWYQGGRVPLPEVGQPVAVRLEWTGTTLTSATADGQEMFGGAEVAFPHSACGTTAASAGTVAFKAGRWSGVSTEYLLSGIHYTGQAYVGAYEVSGTVVDGNGNGVEGASVSIGGKTVATGSGGAFSFNGGNIITEGSHDVLVEKAGYASARSAVTVSGGDVTGLRLVLQRLPDVTGTIVDAGTRASVAGAWISVGGKQAVSNEDGWFSVPGVAPGTYVLEAAADGYQRYEQEIAVPDSGDLNLGTIELEEVTVETAHLSNAVMDVLVDRNFPRVIQYSVKSGPGAGSTLHGQADVLDTIRINGVDVKPYVTSEAGGDGSSMTYTMAVQDEGDHIDATITMEMLVDGNTLELHITDVAYADPGTRLDYPVESIMIPNHSLISVRSTEDGAALAAARLGGSTIAKGDVFYDVDSSLNVSALNGQGYMYVFLSNSDLSAGISSNSDYGSGSAGGTNYRMTVSAEDRGAYKTVGAGSSLWYYDRRVSSSDSDPAQNAPIAWEDSVVGIRPGVDEMPYVKVVVTGDENGDGTVDWQDGAIAAREQEIIHIPTYSESVRDLVTTRIAMNFQSQATNPFLTTLDNVKRVSLHSDGLGQSILLKGYANEGHDSGHPDYFDIGRRMGGAEDFNTMLTEGHKYGAEFGIHVNASEFYPEAKSFSEDLVRRVSPNGALSYGWNWLDQGIGINGLYDLASGSRMVRWDKLYGQVADRLDYVYVDVWGNLTSGTEDAWQTRKLSNEIISHNWRVTHEWGYANEWDSTFQHWVSDFGYGGYDQKGQLNSEIMRFLLNSYKDSFPPDFPTYGGASNAPLLGGPVMQGFEGWQGDVEYDLFIDTLYNQMIPTKFLQHYDVMKWVDNGEAVNMPYGTTKDGFSGTTNWTPEVQITLQSQDRADTVVVTRGSDGEINSSYAYGTEADKLEYRSRTITLNGITILTGAPDPGDFTSNAPAGNMKYLIPWYWDVNGERVPSGDEKLYHYSLTGGSSTWTLPDGWEDLSSVMVYTLTDQGRTDPVAVAVDNGQITLTAEAGVPYVVIKGEYGAPAPTVEWSTGTHLVDVSFNGTLTDSWAVSGSGSAGTVRTSHGIPMLKADGEVSVSQVITGLRPGQKYAVYVGVDNRSDAKASMTVTSGGDVLASNYTLRSVARNYVNSDIHRHGHPTEDGSSFFQNMYVFFTAPANEAVLTLSREAGEGSTYFDDVRVVENESDHYTYAADGSVLSFHQDFEDVAQGLFPFVIGPAQGVNDGRAHLSELHAPFTQSGWDVKKMDDVLNGDWSLKINGLVGYDNIIYNTIPQNFHFEPGKTYTVSFKYQLGSEGAYDVVYGSGLTTDAELTAVPLEMSLGETATCTFVLIGDESGQTWFGIRSTSRGGNTQGTSGAAANFGGYNDFVLDDLTISVSQTQKGVLSQLVQQSSGMSEDGYTGNWAAFEAAREQASQVLADLDATQEEVDQAADALSAAIRALVRVKTDLTGVVRDAGGDPISGASVILEDSRYVPTGEVSVTDKNGRYDFSWMQPGSYKVKVTAAGYDVRTLDVETLIGGTTNTLDVRLDAQMEAPYENTFDTGGVSMMQPMAGNAGGGKDEIPAAVEYNGSGALQVTYNNYERNTVVDDSLQMVDGTVEVDVTPLVSGVRFGITLRGQDLVNRIYVGPFDNDGRWGWNCFVNGSENWSAEYPGPGLYAGVTRHVKITLDGDKLSLWVDGVLLMDELTIDHQPATAGYVGLNAGRNPGTKFVFDNLRIIPADEPEAGTASITGTVKDALGGSVVGAQITVSKDSASVTRSTAAADGSFRTMPLESGGYSLTVSAPGFLDKSVAASAGDADVAIVLSPDPEYLRALYEQYASMEQGGYTAESWQAFQAALESVRAVLEKGSGAADEEILAAASALDSAVNGLRTVSVDKDILRILFNAYNAQPNTGYTDSSWNALQAALTAAADVLSDPGAVQQEVDDAASALQRAYDGLVPGSGSESADKSALRTLYAACLEIRNTGYTASSWNALQNAMARARAVLDDAGASQNEIDAAYRALRGAYEGLTLSSGGSGSGGTPSLPPASPTEPSEPSQPDEPVRPIEPGQPTAVFRDVPSGAYYAGAVEWAVAQGITTGTGAGTFSPDSVCTRGQVVTFLWRAAGSPAVEGDNPFTDVASGAYYHDAVLWAVAQGITNGTGTDTFDPDATCTRGQVVTFLWRNAGSPATGGSDPFADVASGAYYYDAVLWAVAHGVTNGAGANAFSPMSQCTRGQIVTFLYRALAD